MLDKIIEEKFLGRLQEEVIPERGCTEAIALGDASVKAQEVIVDVPIKIIAKCNGKNIRNVVCVAIPNTNEKKVRYNKS